MQKQRLSPSSPTSQGTSSPTPGIVEDDATLDLEPDLSTEVDGPTGGLSVRWGGLQMDDEETDDAPVAPPPPVIVSYVTTEPADAAGHTADLSAGDAIGAETTYVKVDVGGPRWLDIGTLSPADRVTVVGVLSAANGQFSLDGHTLVCGTATSTPHISADTRDPQEVLDAANAGGANTEIWSFLNGGETVLEADDANSDGWAEGQTKPGAWYNAYRIEDGEVVGSESAFDTRDQEVPDLDMDGLKDLIMRSLNTGGIRQAVGDSHDAFVSLLQERFAAESGLGEGPFTALCDVLWSYLTTGAGPDGVVDIAHLQACVRALSPDTKITADTNTTFDGPAFTLPGTDTELASGDGAFGRATMLSLMHLFSEVTTVPTDPGRIDLTAGGQFHDGDYFLCDQSGSMTDGNRPWPLIESAVNQSQGWGPTDDVDARTVGIYDQVGVQPGTDPVASMTESLTRAWETLFDTDTPENRKIFADFFGVRPGQIFNDAGLMPTALMNAIGDIGSGSGAAGESSLKAMLVLLTHPESLPADHPLRVRIEQGVNDPNTDPIRLNTVADEPEQSLEYLRLVQALADKLGVDVRIIAVPTQQNTVVQQNPVGSLVFVDLENVELHPGSQSATVPYTQGGVPQSREVPIFGMDPARAGNPDQYRGSRMQLNGRQGIRGVME